MGHCQTAISRIRYHRAAEARLRPHLHLLVEVVAEETLDTLLCRLGTQKGGGVLRLTPHSVLGPRLQDLRGEAMRVPGAKVLQVEVPLHPVVEERKGVRPLLPIRATGKGERLLLPRYHLGIPSRGAIHSGKRVIFGSARVAQPI